MLFNDLKVGQQFKYPNLNEIFIKVEIPEGFLANNDKFGILEVAENRVWKHLELTQQFLTLQKVKKTEKKWVEKKLRDTNRGQEFKFGPGSHEGVMIRLENHTEELKRHTFYVARDGSYLSTGIPWAPVWVEEDTVVETEEWLP